MPILIPILIPIPSPVPVVTVTITITIAVTITVRINIPCYLFHAISLLTPLCRRAQATAAKDIVGKVFGIWLPISAFVTMGFEHSVANMFLLPFGILQGADITVGQAIAKNLIPVTLGNLVGGAIFVGAFYHNAYGK